MRTSGAIGQHNNLIKQGLPRRIALSNRPRLNIDLHRVDAISAVLVASPCDRARFMENPTSYLQGQSMPVVSCTVTKPAIKRVPQTSELLSAVICCTSLMKADASQYACVDVDTTVYCTSLVTIWVIGAELRNEPNLARNFDWRQGSEAL